MNTIEELSEVLYTRDGQILVLKNDLWTDKKRQHVDGILDYDSEILCLRGWLESMQDPIFLDIGANVGVFVLHLRYLCSEVHAWEPQRFIYSLLAGTIRLNQWSNVHAHWAALGIANDTIIIPALDYSMNSNFGGLELRPLANSAPIQLNRPDGDWVPLHTLDFYNLPRVDVMKIDVEGMELEVLQGAEATIMRCRPKILVEYVKAGLEPLTRWLEKHGYKSKHLDGNLVCEPVRAQETELCRIGAWYGTDKSLGHSYTPFYHSLFHERRDSVKKVLEIGIDRGYSLFMWRAYFPNAQIYALDSNPERMLNIRRIQSAVCDQSDLPRLQSITEWTGRDFDLIVDDGSHQPWHQVQSAKVFVPLLAPGGVYVIEDVGFPDHVIPELPFPAELHEFNIKERPDDALVVIHA